jgi:hypothetical protein
MKGTEITFGGFHGLRHTFVTHLCKADISPKTARTLARHSDIRRQEGSGLQTPGFLGPLPRRLILPYNQAIERRDACVMVVAGSSRFRSIAR